MIAGFTHEVFAELGFSFTPEEEAKLIEDMTHALEENVGLEVMRGLNIQQRKEMRRLERRFGYGGDAEWDKWLDANAPWSKEVVGACYNIMIGDLLAGERNWRQWDWRKSIKRTLMQRRGSV